MGFAPLIVSRGMALVEALDGADGKGFALLRALDPHQSRVSGSAAFENQGGCEDDGGACSRPTEPACAGAIEPAYRNGAVWECGGGCAPTPTECEGATDAHTPLGSRGPLRSQAAASLA